MSNCACSTSLSLEGHLDQVRPAMFFIELTHVCNNACAGCGNVFDHGGSRPPLSAAQWCAIFERLIVHKPRLRLTGGEPTLHLEFEQIINYVRDVGFPFSVFSNARWQNADRIVGLLSDTPQLEYVLVSLHGARAESHEAFTAVPGSFSETVENIQKASKAGLPVTTSTVVTRYNYNEVEKIINVSQEMGAKRAIFNRYIGAPLPSLEASSEELRAAVQKVEQQKTISGNGRIGFGTPIPHCFSPNSSNGCTAGYLHVTIDPWGNLRPCPHVPIIAGNVLNGKGMDAILHSPAMATWRSEYLTQCEGCGHEQGCFAGCLATGMARSGRDPLLC